ncbi:ATP-binding protein [Marinobacterium litorale]|uniref:ATP-binding protein n=1 Tax=Marinobacterium litorale TaxID=404770 RepID=UPI0004036301|nr:ATP-binding protein [Marinobacterium litorale]
MLTQKALEHFGLDLDPFIEPLVSADDYFVTPNLEHCCGLLCHAAAYKSFVTVKADAGGGKTTAINYFLNRAKSLGIRVAIADLHSNDIRECMRDVFEAVIKEHSDEVPKSFDRVIQDAFSILNSREIDIVVIDNADFGSSEFLEMLLRCFGVNSPIKGDNLRARVGMALFGDDFTNLERALFKLDCQEADIRMMIRHKLDILESGKQIQNFVCYLMQRAGGDESSVFNDEMYEFFGFPDVKGIALVKYFLIAAINYAAVNGSCSIGLDDITGGLVAAATPHKGGEGHE